MNTQPFPQHQAEEDTPPKSARPKTTPSSQINFRFTKAKQKTIELIAEYFCLRTNDIAKLLREREPNENDKRTVRRTLGLLYKAGYVNRLPYLDPEENDGRGNTTFAYGLSDKGVDLVIGEFPFLGLIAKTFDEHSARTLDHELEISLFHAELKNFCRTAGFQFFWQQKGLKKKTIAPDAYFCITDPTLPQGKNRLHYFLEIERSKIGNMKNGEPSIIRKLGEYYDYFDTDECEKEWKNFRKFRVIVIQRTEAKRRFLLETLKENYAHRMFWLTTESACIGGIGGAIFHTPGDYETQAYSFQTAF